MTVEGQPRLGVTLMGEALGEKEAKEGGPFKGPAGFRFEKMIERAGFARSDFQILNAVWCRPPYNREPSEGEINHCRQYWEHVVRRPETKVIVPMGNVPLWATIGEEGILAKRGYVWWSDTYNAYVLPTVHPSYIMRGNSNWEAAWLYDVRHAVEVSRDGWSPVTRDNTLDPNPGIAMMWAKTFALRLQQDPTLALGTDIETPDKGTAEDEVDINLGYMAGPIYRIGFAYIWAGHTLTLTIPWDANYLEVIRFLLALKCPKVFWYRHFDVPRIRAHGMIINPDIHDGAEMWHTLHSDLPKKLEHVTPFLQPRQPAWKHLNHGDTAAFYNATDAGVQVEHYYTIKRLLTQYGMWELYERDVFGLNPILIFMSDKGMPIDMQKRKEASLKCMELKEAVRVKLNEAAAQARPNKVLVRKPKDIENYEEITVEGEERFCSDCGAKNVSKKHPCFKVGNAPGEVPLGEPRTRMVPITGWTRPLDFKPSQPGLIRYAQYRGYKLISRWDKATSSRKTSMDETAVRQYALKYPTDPLWPLVLEERELNKLLGTYIGRLTDKAPKTKTQTEEWQEAWTAATFREGAEKDRAPRLQKAMDYDDDSEIPF